MQHVLICNLYQESALYIAFSFLEIYHPLCLSKHLSLHPYLFISLFILYQRAGEECNSHPGHTFISRPGFGKDQYNKCVDIEERLP